MKKILAVATALVLAISSLCVFVVADTTDYDYTLKSAGNGSTVLTSVSSSLYEALNTSGATITMSFTVTGDYNVALAVQQTSGSWGGSWWTVSTSGTSDGTEPVTVTWTDISSLTGSAYLIAGDSQLLVNNNESVALSDVTVTVSVPETSSSSSTVEYPYSMTSAGSGSSVLTSVSSTLYDALTKEGTTITMTFTVTGDYNVALAVQQTSGSWSGSWWTVNTSGTSDGTEPVTVTWSDLSSLTGSAYLIAGDSQLLINSNGSATLSDITVVVTAVAEEERREDPSIIRYIYVNEEYHGIVLQRGVRRYLISIPHTLNAAGYCTGCGEYIGTGEVETVTINDAEYVVAYTTEVGIGSTDGWGQLDLGSTELIDALSQEGAILAITRDGVSDTVFSNEDETYEKFGLVNAWWSGSWLALGTAGHTSADEEGTVDCMSDDGTTVMYDGATVYAAWTANGLNNSSNTVIISNTSNSLKIASVTVYVPAE